MAYQSRYSAAMEHRRQTAGTIALFCCLVSFLARVADANDGTGRLVQLPPSDSTGPQQLCQDLCGECQCSGQLVGENVCLCNCDFPSASAGGSNCTVKVKRLCQQLDVECNFNGPEITYVRAGRGCHSMSCYEKEHGYGEGHEGYYGADEEGGEYGEGYGAPGAKELICCKDKKHKEKKHKHKPKKHHKKEKHTKFHIIIKGKMPEPQCHHEGGGDYDGGYDEYEGYRAVAPENRHPSSSFGGHVPMEVTVWKNGKKQPVRKPSHQQQHQHQQPPPHYAHPAPSPESGPRGKSSEPSLPPPPPPRERPPQEQPPQRPHPPTPAEPEMPPEEPLTPPPNLFDGAPITPDRRPPAPEEPPKPHTTQSPPPPPAPKAPPPPPSVFLRPAPPPPPPPPPSFYRPAPPPPPPPAPRRMEASRSYDEPSYSSCQFESYDLNYFHPPQFYSAPPPSPPPPPPPPSPPASSSFYRSYSPSFDPYTSSYYQPQYETPEHYPYDYDEPASYREHDDSPGYPAGPPSHGHGVHPLSDDEVEDWAPPPVRDPADTLAFNQIVSRQIWQNERAILYSTPPFQPTPRPLRDEFEPPVAEIGPVQYEAGGSGEKNYYQEFPLAPPADAFIPPVPAPDSPVEFPTAEHMPAAYPGNSEEAQYRPPTPPPHYVRMKGVGRMSSFGYDRPSHGSGGGYRSASHGRTGPSQQWVSASGRRF